MTMIGQSSLSRYLRGGLRGLSIAFLLGFAGICIAALACTVLLVTGHLPVDRQLNVPRLFLAAAALAAAYYIARQLKDLFDAFARSEPFDAANAGRLRRIAAAFAFMDIAKLIIAGAQAALASALHISPAHVVAYAPNPMTWFMVLLLLVIAEAFREGARLRDEQNLTV